MKVAIEPLVPSELPKMLEALRNINKSYSLISRIYIFQEMIVKLFFLNLRKKSETEIVLKVFFIYNDVVIISCYLILNYIL